MGEQQEIRQQNGAGARAGSHHAGDGRDTAGTHASLILTNATLRGVADIGSKLATAALYVLLARKVGATQFGVFVFALSLVGIVITFGQFGQDTVLVREVARDHRRLDEYYSNALVSRVLLSVPPLVIALAVALLVGTKSHTELVLAFIKLSMRTAEKILRRKLDDSTHRELVGEFIDEVGALP